jgi:hypothetical protein
VTVKEGVVRLGRESTPNPVLLAPYRTFTEVSAQPVSSFVLRIRPGVHVLLKAADGDAWEVDAGEKIAVALERMLSEGHPPILS